MSLATIFSARCAAPRFRPPSSRSNTALRRSTTPRTRCAAARLARGCRSSASAVEVVRFAKERRQVGRQAVDELLPLGSRGGAGVGSSQLQVVGEAAVAGFAQPARQPAVHHRLLAGVQADAGVVVDQAGARARNRALPNANSGSRRGRRCVHGGAGSVRAAGMGGVGERGASCRHGARPCSVADGRPLRRAFHRVVSRGLLAARAGPRRAWLDFSRTRIPRERACRHLARRARPEPRRLRLDAGAAAARTVGPRRRRKARRAAPRGCRR